MTLPFPEAGRNATDAMGRDGRGGSLLSVASIAPVEFLLTRPKEA